MVSCLGQEVQGNCLNLELLLLLFFDYWCCFLLNSLEWNEKGEGVKPRFIIKTFFRSALFCLCGLFFMSTSIFPNTHVHIHTQNHTRRSNVPKKKKKSKNIKYWKIIKKIIFFFFLSSRQVRWHSLPQTITSFSTHLSLHHAVLAQCFICLRYLQFWD